MKFLNCDINELDSYFGNTRIVFFGAGCWMKMINHTDLMKYKNKFCYIIDNNASGEFKLSDVILPIFKPEKLVEEKNCAIILTSPIYMFDMYCQLDTMKLADSIWCFAFPFILLETECFVDKSLLNSVINIDKNLQIPKIIHSFWFSGEEKSPLYKKSIASWKECLHDYQIIEWNLDNYDWHKHPFLERAVQYKAWAYATDFARLDVLHEYGGIYMDMDVEVFRSFNNLLSNQAVLSFYNPAMIDLAFCASTKKNGVIEQMLRLYDDIELPNSKPEFSKFFQPAFIRETLVNNGIIMDGSLQRICDATVFPPKFFMPQDAVLFRDYEKTEYTYCVHHDNFGWGNNLDVRAKKIRDNNILWKKLYE